MFILQAHFNINTCKYFSCRKTRLCASDFKYFFYSLSLLFICLFASLSICLFTLRGWTFPLALSEKLIAWAKCVTLIILAKFSQIFLIHQVKSTRKILHTLKAFRNFSFFCFHWKITWHLGKVNKKVNTETVRNWTDTRVWVHEFQRSLLFTL